MFAVRPDAARRGGEAPDGRLRAQGFVLPRWLRKPARVAGRVFAGDMRVPRYAATVMSAGFLALTGLYGAALGGHMPAIVQMVTAHSGFAIEDVRVTGNRETSDIDILQEIGLDGWTSLIGFDAEAARGRIVNLPWVESVSLRKVYPGAIEINLVEKKPLAIWQHGRELSLIDGQGRTIVPFAHQRYGTLPLFIGVGANERGAEFSARLAGTPELAARVKAFIRVADRRWDLRLENGVTIRLPEHGEDAAIAEIAALDREQGILSRDIVAIDMRIEDRLVVKLTPEAAERRKTMVSDRGKKTGRPEKRI